MDNSWRMEMGTRSCPVCGVPVVHHQGQGVLVQSRQRIQKTVREMICKWQNGQQYGRREQPTF